MVSVLLQIYNQEVDTEEHVLTRCPASMIFRNELYTGSSDINDVFIHMNDCDKICIILNDRNLCRLTPKSATQCYAIEEYYYIPDNVIVHLNIFMIDCLMFMQCFHVLKSLISLLREAFLIAIF